MKWSKPGNGLSRQPKETEWSTATPDHQSSFYDLTPERILDAVETSGLVCTGTCNALNSYENRVYEVEVEESPGTIGRRHCQILPSGSLVD